MSNQENSTAPKAWILLQDGTFLEGIAFGATGTTGGELCFTTGMTGYQEVFTDPSYSGQVLIMNNVHVGNYGVRSSETESNKVRIRALVARNVTDRYSRLMAEGSLADYFKEHKIIAISGIDTRSLVTHVRNRGAMNAVVSTEISDPVLLKKELDKIPDMSGLDLSAEASTKSAYELGTDQKKYKIAVYDFGVKEHILHNLVDRGAHVKVFPARTPISETESFAPDGYFISNGPGDPAAMDYALVQIKDILKTGKPIFGICLGHQLLARTMGLSTYKMHHGHRGLNHPVKNIITGKSEITTQNHGFGVDIPSAEACEDIEITHINLNDDSIEGLRLRNYPAFSVQYHPESTPGSHDARYLFDEFIQLLKQAQGNK